jgi:hypothetical protein
MVYCFSFYKDIKVFFESQTIYQIKMKFILTESEKKEILDMYGLLTEQKFYQGSTDNTPMYNFPKKKPDGSEYSSNHRNFGLPGEQSQENFTFTTTVKDIMSKLRGPETSFFSGFKPKTDMKKYVDYISVGGKKLQGGGTIELDFSDPNAEVEGSHNGLLALKRVMEAMKQTPGGTKVKITMGTVDTRVSGIETVTPNRAYALGGALDQIVNITSIALLSSDKSIYFNKVNFKDNQFYNALAKSYRLTENASPSEQQLITSINTRLDLMGRLFLTKKQEDEVNKFDAELKMSNKVDVGSYVRSVMGKKVAQAESIMNEFFNKIIETYKKLYSDFVKKYNVNTADGLITKMNSNIDTKLTSNLKDIVSEITRGAEVTYGSTKQKTNTQTQSAINKEVGQ